MTQTAVQFATKTEEKAAERKPVPIPGPRSLPFLGNLRDIDPKHALASVVKLGEQYGPIFGLKFGGIHEIIVSSQELINEVCDESRFVKAIPEALEALRPAVKDGLFTAYPDEEGWAIAHRICLPAFGPIKIGEMFPAMGDIAQQLCLKWARLGRGYEIDVTSDFTRLTLDTIGLCAMDFRFNSFYAGDSVHPFVGAMNRFLGEAQIRSVLPKLVNSVRISASENYEKDIATMRSTSRDIIESRRRSSVRKNDLLDNLLYGQDPVTGKCMDDNLIISNMITFLVAGHETTSGLLSFTTYYMLAHPEEYDKARKEIDKVVGSGQVGLEHLSKLKYLEAMLKESLRLMPTAPGFAVRAKKPELLQGKYAVDEKTPITVLLPLAHQDEKAWGPDVQRWRPERMLDENFKKLPPGSFKPFGNGTRACIGRAFAMQEALLVLAMVIQTFDLKLADPNYKLKYKESLTIKPDGLRIKASFRDGRDALDMVTGPGLSKSANDTCSPSKTSMLTSSNSEARPATILYGSNAGTCKALASRLAAVAERDGFRPHVEQLNTAVESLPRDQPVLLVTTSYEGEATDDAKQFVKWLQGSPELDGLQYAVFGCGHRDWPKTLHKIPKYIDKRLEELGGKRICPIGTVDVSENNVVSALDLWKNDYLWPALGQATESATSNSESIVSTSLPLRATALDNALTAVVTTNRVLTSPNQPVKRYMEFKLDGDCSYEPGDHFYVLVQNPPALVHRALAYFHLTPDTTVTINSYNSIGLPANTSLTAFDLFSSHLELAQIASSKNIERIRELSNGPIQPEHTQNTSLLTILESLRAHFALPLSTYISLLPPLRTRIYSASSYPNHSLTYSVPPDSIGPSFLSSLLPGSAFHIIPRPAKPAFHLPEDQTSTPIIMIAAGSGLAPFRAFIQKRISLTLKKDEETNLAEALLFFGCRNRDEDDLFPEEFPAWETKGRTKILTAYSRADEGRMYVQGLVKQHALEVKKMWDDGAKVYICGNGGMADEVERVLRDILELRDDYDEQWEKRVVFEKFN